MRLKCKFSLSQEIAAYRYLINLVQYFTQHIQRPDTWIKIIIYKILALPDGAMPSLYQNILHLKNNFWCVNMTGIDFNINNKKKEQQKYKNAERCSHIEYNSILVQLFDLICHPQMILLFNFSSNSQKPFNL